MTATRVLTVNDSSNISVIMYDHDSRDMIVDFTKGNRYLYHDVEPTDFGGLAASDSVGEMFNRWARSGDRKFERIK
jgi:hypothetical protein